MGFPILESTEKATYSKRSCATLLSILLLRFGNESSYIVDSWLVFILKAEWLTFNASHINQNTSISLKTRKSKHKMFVNSHDFSDCAWILQFHNTVFLNCQYNTVGTFETDSTWTSIDCLKSILNLKQLTIWSKNCDCFIVLGHLFLY